VNRSDDRPFLWWAPPPWAPSGYGVQSKLFVQRLIKMGIPIVYGAYAGVHETGDWNGIPLISLGGRQYGNGLVQGTVQRTNARAVVLLCDAFCVEPTQFRDLMVIPWMPIDTNPIGEPDGMWLQAVASMARLQVVAMSEHGKNMLKPFELASVPVIPHAFDPAVYFPDGGEGQRWRREQGVPPDAFLITMCGVNEGYPDRKGFQATLQAYQEFSSRHKDTVLYLHTDAQSDGGLNLAKVALSLGLKGKMFFADEYTRRVDAYSETYMRGMYNASNLYSQTSLGEGFGVNVIEALACGVPAVITNSSAQQYLINPDIGWRVHWTTKHWVKHHNSWWVLPDIAGIVHAYEEAYAERGKAAKMRSRECARHSARYAVDKVAQQWKEVLDGAATRT
jgi:glycosyltransferase involved in cell wall biosynthesis